MRGLLCAAALVAALVTAVPAAAQSGSVTTGYAMNPSAEKVTLTGELTGDWNCSGSGPYYAGRVSFDLAESASELSPVADPNGSATCGSNGKSFEQVVWLGDEWPGTTFWFRAAYYQQTYGSGVGGPRSFRIPETEPTVHSARLSEIDYESVTFRPEIQDGGRVTTWRVLYGPEAEGLTYKTSTQSMDGDGGAPEEVIAFAEGLQPCTTYRYLVEATNAHGTDSLGSTFKTLGCPPPPTNPEPAITYPSQITETSALLGGAVSSERDFSWWFEYGPVGGELLTTQPDGPKAGSSHSWFVEATVTGLIPGTRYRYQTVARNDKGELGASGWEYFTTAGTAPPAPPAGGGGPPLVPVSPGGTVVTPSPNVPLRALLASSDAPKESLAAALARQLGGLRRGAVRVRNVPVPAAGRLSVVVRHGRTVVARGSVTSTRAGTRTVLVRRTRRIARGAKLSVAATFSPKKGRATRMSAPLTLR